MPLKRDGTLKVLSALRVLRYAAEYPSMTQTELNRDTWRINIAADDIMVQVNRKQEFRFLLLFC